MTHLQVYKGDTKVGYGFFITDNDGRHMQPLLFDNDGKELPKEEWYSLIPIDNSIVVIAKAKQ